MVGLQLRTQSSAGRYVDIVFVVVFCLAAMAVFPGCVGGETEEARERRFAQQRQEENAKGRREGQGRARAVEATFDLQLRRASRPFQGCGVEYGSSVVPKLGVVAIACGNFGPNWPLTVERGFLRCELWPGVFGGGRIIVFTAADDREYAVNDAGHAVGYPKVVPLLRDPSHPRLSRQPLVRRGLRLCSDAGIVMR